MSLLRANYGIDHGGFAFASKFAIQEAIGANYFPPTLFLSKTAPLTEKNSVAAAFAEAHDEIGRIVGRSEALNLDRRAAILACLRTLAEAARN